MAATYETSIAPQNVSFLAAGEAETVVFDAGTGADRVLLVFVSWNERTNSISGVTYNGVAMTSAGAKVTQGTLSGQLWSLANPASGSNNIVVTMGATSGGNSAGQISAWVANSADVSGTPVDGYTSATGSGSTANIVSAVTISSATGDRVAVFHATINGSENLTAAATNYTERQDVFNGGGISTEFGDADGAASIASSATWSNSAITVNWIALGININATASGGVPRFAAFYRMMQNN